MARQPGTVVRLLTCAAAWGLNPPRRAAVGAGWPAFFDALRSTRKSAAPPGRGADRYPMMDKSFDASAVEARVSALWEAEGAFRAGRPERAGAEPFCMVIPPPNVTGALHMGHALNNTLQDILARYRRISCRRHPRLPVGCRRRSPGPPPAGQDRSTTGLSGFGVSESDARYLARSRTGRFVVRR